MAKRYKPKNNRVIVPDKTPTGWVGPGKMSYRTNPIKGALKKRITG